MAPGMLNMCAANRSIVKGIADAKKFVYGVIIIVAFQAFNGFYFAEYLQNHPAVAVNLKFIGSLVFITITLFFIYKGIQSRIQEPDLKVTTKTSRFSAFANGAFLSAINVLPVPYYSFLSLYFSSFTPHFFDICNGIAFALGGVLGTAVALFIYVYLFKKYQNKVNFFIKNVNFIIAFITAAIAFFTLYNL
jgi:hypothetical protein